MQKVLTKSQMTRNERDEAVRAKYNEYMAAGSMKMAVYELLASEFGISHTTVANIVNGYQYNKPKRRHRLRKRRASKSN